MPLPLVEALSALSTLLGTYQVVLVNRTGEAPSSEDDLTAPALVIAYEFVQREMENSARLLDSVRSRLLQVVAVAGLALVGAPAIVALGDREPDLESALFLTALGFFCFIAAVAVFVRSLNTGRRVSPFELYEKWLVEPESRPLDAVVRISQAAYQETVQLTALGRGALVLVSIALIVQILLLAAWIPVGQ